MNLVTRNPARHGEACHACGARTMLYETCDGDWVRTTCAGCGAVTVRLSHEVALEARTRVDKRMGEQGLLKEQGASVPGGLKFAFCAIGEA